MERIIERNRCINDLLNQISPVGINPMVVADACLAIIHGSIVEALEGSGHGREEYVDRVRFCLCTQKTGHELCTRLNLIFDQLEGSVLNASLIVRPADADEDSGPEFAVMISLVQLVPLPWSRKTVTIDTMSILEVLSEEDCLKPYGGHGYADPYNLRRNSGRRPNREFGFREGRNR